MAVIYEFWDNTFIPAGTNATPTCVVGQTVKPGYNGTIVAVQFYKIASDTGTHTAFVWRESDQALLGSQAFTGETATGWQTVTFSAPIAVLANINYRVCVSHATQPWAANASYGGGMGGSPVVLGSVMTMSGGFYGLGSQTAYPTNSSGDYYGVDVRFDGPVVAADLRVSQALAEAWIRLPAPTTEVVSQALAELWLSRGGSLDPLVVSQALVEAWVAPPPTRWLTISSQVV